MAKKQNTFAKRQREIAKKRKAEEKRERRWAKKEQKADPEDGIEAALELGKYGIRVNAICPEAGSADMLAPYIPDGVDIEKVAVHAHRLLATQKDRSIRQRLDDIAQFIVFLASDESLSCTGADFAIDSGNTAGRISRAAPGA